MRIIFGSLLFLLNDLKRNLFPLKIVGKKKNNNDPSPTVFKAFFQQKKLHNFAELANSGSCVACKEWCIFGEAKSCWDGELTMMFWVVLFSSIETICSTVFPPPKKSRIWIFATSSCLDVLYLYVFTLLFEIAMV